MNPLATLALWLDDATRAGGVEPTAMTLATATPDGAPSARIVLCRGVDDAGVRFYTNYESRKGGELGANARAAAVFWWGALSRQVRIEGTIEKLPPADSDAYFARRPRGNQIQAWASPQSQAVDREALLARFEELARQFDGKDVPRPPHWGGYLLRALRVELWTAADARLHDRQLFTRTPQGWRVETLAP